jgi:hypothetical protein
VKLLPNNGAQARQVPRSVRIYTKSALRSLSIALR